MDIAKIMSGSQFGIPLLVFLGQGSSKEAITPQNCDDLEIQVGEILKKYSKNEITYNTQKGCWVFPLKESETQDLAQKMTVQARIIRGNEKYPTQTYRFDIKYSIIGGTQNG